MLRAIVATLVIAVFSFSASARAAQPAPSEIKIGTLYASSGTFASISMPVYRGLKLWADQENAKGGVYVKPYGKRIPVKLVAFNDQSDPATATTLYNQLITQNKVDILTSDSGSVLTAPAVTIAREHKIFLFDQTGTGLSFFSPDNPYIALISDPTSSAWPKYVAEFLNHEGPKLGIKRIALLYSTNDFTGEQAKWFAKMIEGAHAGLKIVYNRGVPTSTSNYTVLIRTILASHPDAVLEMGYPDNDIAFLRSLQSSNTHLKWLFTFYPGLETPLLLKTVGVSGLKYGYTYMPASLIKYKVNAGMTLPEFRDAWKKAYPNHMEEFGFNAIAGYNTGVVIERALAVTKGLSQLDLHDAVFSLSGKLKTLDGSFVLDKMGAQIGDLMPLAQMVPNGKGGLKFNVVYPPDVADAKAIYPAPGK